MSLKTHDTAAFASRIADRIDGMRGKRRAESMMPFVEELRGVDRGASLDAIPILRRMAEMPTAEAGNYAAKIIGGIEAGPAEIVQAMHAVETILDGVRATDERATLFTEMLVTPSKAQGDLRQEFDAALEEATGLRL